MRKKTTTRKMRGVQFSILILFWVIGVAVILAGMKVMPMFRGANAFSDVVKTDVYMMDSAMGGAKAYLNASLQYSNYQACYEMMKNGGNRALDDSNSVTENSRSYGIMPDAAKFSEDFRLSLESNMNAYPKTYSFLKKYSVALPKFAVTVKEDGGNAVAEAKADGVMTAKATVNGNSAEGSKGASGEVSVYRSADVSDRLRINCLAIFRDFKSFDGILKLAFDKKVSDAVKSLTDGIVKDKGSDCETLKEQKETDIKSTNKAFDQPALASGRADASYKIELDFIKLDLGVSLPKVLVPIDTGADKGKYLCKFSVERPAEYAIKTTVTDTSSSAQKVPVRNGEKLSYESIDTVFVIKSG
jgi:hypothetical protein